MDSIDACVVNERRAINGSLGFQAFGGYSLVEAGMMGIFCVQKNPGLATGVIKDTRGHFPSATSTTSARTLFVP